MSAAAARVSGASRRPSSQSTKPAPAPAPAGGGGRDKAEPPPTREGDDTAAAAGKQQQAARRRLPSAPARGATTTTTTTAAAAMLLRRATAGGRASSYVHPSYSSLSASCASEASTDSFCSRASTGRIGRRPAAAAGGAAAAAGAAAAVRRRAAGRSTPPATARNAPPSVVPVGAAVPPAAAVALLNGEAVSAAAGPPRCPWVTPNTDPCYAAFHDKEWGVPVHDDKRLFEMLVLSGALAEMAWPAILSKRDTFREVFMGFDPALVANLSEKKLMAPCSPASSLLSGHRLPVIIENARELLKVIDEFGSFDSYCWSFVSNKPMAGGYRHTREVPLRTAKADAMSQDLMRRGFRGVGPTVVYAFMQAVGMANDHLVTCYRFDECCALQGAATATAAAAAVREGRGGASKPPAAAVGEQEVSMVCGLVECFGMEPPRAATVISIS